MSSISRSPRVDLAGVGVEAQVADHERGAAARRTAAHQRAHPREQLLALERLHEVVVGAGVEALDAVVELAAGGEDQDRHVGLGAQPPADLDPVEAGQAEVEDDQVGDELLRGPQRLDPVDRGADLVALLAQGAAQDVGDRLVVLDHEHASRVLIVAQHSIRVEPERRRTGGYLAPV